MARRTLQLIQILFVFFAIYSVFSYTGNQQKLIPLFCLLAALGLEKLQGGDSGGPDLKEKRRSSRSKKKQAEKEDSKTKAEQINNLLTSKNPIIVADAVQYLFHHLGLFVSRASQSKVVSRLVQSSTEETPIGIIIIQDISKINTAWKEWDAIAEFAAKQGKGYRTLFIWSNCFKTKTGELRSQNFPDNIKKLLIRKNVVAMGTDTFYSLYDLCSSGKIRIKGVLEKIRNHSGGVISLKK